MKRQRPTAYRIASEIDEDYSAVKRFFRGEHTSARLRIAIRSWLRDHGYVKPRVHRPSECKNCAITYPTRKKVPHAFTRSVLMNVAVQEITDRERELEERERALDERERDLRARELALEVRADAAHARPPGPPDPPPAGLRWSDELRPMRESELS